MHLETERLFMRPFDEEDAASVLDFFGDAYAQRFYPWMKAEVDALRWIRRNVQRYEEDGFGLWAVCMKESSAVVGDCGLTYQSVENGREIEVGYHLKAVHRGRGLATEAAYACLNYGFESIDCDQIVSKVHTENYASKAVAERIHRRVRPFLRDGDRHYLFYTTREDWLAGRTMA